MEYRILAASDIETLSTMVNHEIALGWSPQGGIAVSQNHDGSEYYYQAMVRTEA